MGADVHSSRDELVLVLAPFGRDAALACEILSERANVRVHACIDLVDLCAQIQRGCGVALIAEEAIDAQSVGKLADCVASQLPWSDLPLIVLARSAESKITDEPLTFLRQRGNVTLLERQLRIVTLISAVQSALRARRRQYEVRDLLAETRNAVRQRDQFLAMLGHELRNPLGAINSAMSVIDVARPTHDELECEQRGIICRQIAHLSRLVDDLLDVSRITSGKVVLQHRPVDLCDLARRSAGALQSAADAEHHELKIEMACEPVAVDADPVRMEQVINNLLTNAIKYTPPGGKIQIRIEADEENAVLRVRDNGMGIAPDLLPRVFDLFTQAERALDRSQGGLGIGLTLVRSLVEMHDGRVTASSEGIGRGSEFTITLPRHVAVAPEPQPTPSKPINGNGAKRRVLIIEDQADARRALQRLLQLWGHQVEVAADGPAGVEAATTASPDVALVDVGLPGLDGYEVARRIRAKLGSNVRLIALTGYGQPEDRERAFAAGFDQHLVKPIDAHELAESLVGRAPVSEPNHA